MDRLAYSASGMMFEADVVEGRSIETLIEQIFANQEVSYIHVHTPDAVATLSGLTGHR
ncbi:DUF1203 domain-containing protein [Janthinobacterium tructae]